MVVAVLVSWGIGLLPAHEYRESSNKLQEGSCLPAGLLELCAGERSTLDPPKRITSKDQQQGAAAQGSENSLPAAPTSPIPTHFPFPPVPDCPLVTAKAPGSGRISVISCPNTASCTPRTSSIPIPHAGLRPEPSGETQTLSWDNYSETPEFYSSSQRAWALNPLNTTYVVNSPNQRLNSSTDPNQLDESVSSSELLRGLEILRGDSDTGHKIQLVSTVCSEFPEYSPSLTSFLRSNNFDEEAFADCLDQVVTMDKTEDDKLKTLQTELEDELNDLKPSDITKAQAKHIESDLERIWKMKNELRSRVRSLVNPLETTDPDRIRWEKDTKDMVERVVQHKREVWEAVENLCPTQLMTEFQRKSLELQELDLKEKKAARIEAETAAMKAGWAEAKLKLKAFRDEYNELVAEINSDQSSVESRDDVTISQNMQQLQLWKVTYGKIASNFREYERLTSIHGEESPGNGELSTATEEFRAVKESFEKIRDEIELADKVRELFSTHKQVGEKLDYPRFSGAAHEDFTKFQDKMVKAFRRNAVGKSDQVEKLRKVLSGFALSLVPESTESIEKAF